MVSDKHKDCADCPKKHDGFDACDMRAGRDLHREAFEAGKASSDAEIKELVEALKKVDKFCIIPSDLDEEIQQLLAKHGQGGE